MNLNYKMSPISTQIPTEDVAKDAAVGDIFGNQVASSCVALSNQEIHPEKPKNINYSKVSEVNAGTIEEINESQVEASRKSTGKKNSRKAKSSKQNSERKTKKAKKIKLTDEALGSQENHPEIPKKTNNPKALEINAGATELEEPLAQNMIKQDTEITNNLDQNNDEPLPLTPKAKKIPKNKRKFLDISQQATDKKDSYDTKTPKQNTDSKIKKAKKMKHPCEVLDNQEIHPESLKKKINKRKTSETNTKAISVGQESLAQDEKIQNAEISKNFDRNICKHPKKTLKGEKILQSKNKLIEANRKSFGKKNPVKAKLSTEVIAKDELPKKVPEKNITKKQPSAKKNLKTKEVKVSSARNTKLQNTKITSNSKRSIGKHLPSTSKAKRILQTKRKIVEAYRKSTGKAKSSKQNSERKAKLAKKMKLITKKQPGSKKSLKRKLTKASSKKNRKSMK